MTTIPQPPGLPIIGNANDLDRDNASKSFIRLAEQYGDIYRLNIYGRSVVLVNSQALANEICDEKRFHKHPTGSLAEIRSGVGDGLFTAFDHEENWGIAHRVLMPSFGPFAIKGMFGEMHEIAAQMVSRWAREGPETKIDPTTDFTKIALDSIALCAMDTRFNSFYREEMHPFVSAMGFFLQESGHRAMRPKFMSEYVYRASTRKYWETIEIMQSTARQAIKERRETPNAKKDLLNAMLEGVDAKSGKKMSDESIIRNAITFLIAGHETTAGTMSFVFVALLKNPAAMAKAQKEVDEVVGTGPVTLEHMSKLPYISACIRETLRVWSPITAWSVRPRDEQPDQMFIGKEQYIINKNETLVANLSVIHKDPTVYGADANEFKPERMLDEPFNKLPPNSWKPFGNGARGCIGRAFAWQEMHIVLALILQNFNLRATDPNYVLDTQATLTIKPKGFTMHASLRSGLDPIALERRVWGGKEAPQPSEKDHRVEGASVAAKKPMTILFGSNTGTCEALAQNLANGASSRGYNPQVKSMDAGADDIPANQPVVVITASYEGEPPDNAAHFMERLKTLKSSELKGVKHAVFGCGNHDWVNTFQKIPTLADNLLIEGGSIKICNRGLSDVAENHIFDDFDAWADHSFWPGVASEFGGDATSSVQSFGLDVELEPGSRASDLRHDVSDALVLSNTVLTALGEPVKKHVEIQLPSGMTYSAGDYLAVLPLNPEPVVKAVMARFALPWDARVTIKDGQHTFLPVGRQMSIHTLLSAYVELQLPATQKNISVLANSIEDLPTRSRLLATPSSSIAEKHISVLDLLEQYPACALPLGDYLAMLSPLRVRQYSISSSPLARPSSCTLTYGVLDAPAAGGRPGKRFLGTASNYLASLAAGDRVLVSVRPASAGFRIPVDVERTPVIMVCAGSGLAPFRGFVEERASQVAAGRSLAPAMLFVGCRGPERDALHREEFERWQREGVVDVRYAFSGAEGESEGCRYVQDRLWRDRREAEKLWEDGGRLYVCGKGEVGEAVRDVVVRTAMEAGERQGKVVERERAEAWFEGVRGERFASDVFA